MNVQSWIDWAQKQLGDLSARMLRQGYTPSRIDFLNQTNSEFAEQFNLHVEQLNEAIEQMAAFPDGYHHFDTFSAAKTNLLAYMNKNRERFLELDLRRTA